MTPAPSPPAASFASSAPASASSSSPSVPAAPPGPSAATAAAAAAPAAVRRGKPQPLFEPRAGSSLDANALELLAQVAAAGSFAQAARQLGLTRAAVSRRVAVIEAQIGHSLFQRSTRAFKLTEAGRRLALRGREVHEAAQAARQGLRRAGEAAQADGSLHGSLRITSVPNLGQSVLAPLLARFAAQHPRLRLDLRFTHRRLDLLRDDIDLALRVTERPPEDCVATPLLRFAVRAYAAPGAGLPLAAPADLAYHPCLVLGLPSDGVAALWRQDQQPRREAEVRLEPAVQGDDLACLIALAQHGGGIVFAPDYCVQRELAEGRLIEALPGWRMALYEGQTVMALTPPVAQASAAARALVQFLKANLSPS